jgi:hypothetical protein
MQRLASGGAGFKNFITRVVDISRVLSVSTVLFILTPPSAAAKAIYPTVKSLFVSLSAPVPFPAGLLERLGDQKEVVTW